MNFKKTLAAFALSMMVMANASASTTLSGTIHLAPAGRNGVAVNSPDHSITGVAWGLGGSSKGRTARLATLQLIAMDIDMKSIPHKDIDAWYHDGIAPEGYPIFITKSAEDGTYSFEDIPQGSYYLLIIAPGQLNNWEKPLSQKKAEEKLKNYLPNWDAFSLLTLGMSDYTIKEVNILKGVNMTVDYDFNESPLKSLSK